LAVRRREEVMGMPITVHVVDDLANDEAIDAVFHDFTVLDRTFSPFRADSAVSRINRRELRSEDAGQLVNQAIDLCRLYEHATAGYFSAWINGRFDPSGLIKGWAIDRAPVLGDAAYGENTRLRGELDSTGIEYVLSINPETTIFGPGTVFAIPARRQGSAGRAPAAHHADRDQVSVGEYAKTLTAEDFQTVAFRGKGKTRLRSRFAFKRITAAHPVTRERVAPREEWLIIEWPEDQEHPSDYWIANLPADTTPERLARLVRLRWVIELDYRQLKGELGLDHYEGRSYLGFHHHCAIVTAAHGFLTLERLDPNRPRPA